MIAATVVLIAITTPALLLARVNRRSFDIHRVYVSRFANLTNDPDLDPLGGVATDRVVQALTATGLLEIASPVSLGDSVGGATRGARNTIALREAAEGRAGLVVSGEIRREGTQITIQAWVTDVTRDRVVWAIEPITASDTAALQAIEEVRERTTGAIVALNTPRYASWFPVASAPPRFSAFQEYAKGVDLQLRGADREALEHLRRAVALDSTFTWARLQLAQAHHALFEAIAADSIALALNARREQLRPLQRHWLDWMLALRAEDKLGAYGAISDAAAVAPEVFLFTQADWAFRLNRPREAASLLERLGPDGPFGREVAYWRELSKYYHALGDQHRELNAARQARRRYPDRIDALSSVLAALASRGKVREVNALLDSALAFPRPKPESQGAVVEMWGGGFWPGRLMITAATEFRAHGFESAADETFRRAIAWYGTLEQADVPAETHRFEHARALYLTGQWSRAKEKFEALATADPHNIILDGFLGAIAARVGDTVTARGVLSKFEQERRNLERPHAIAGYWIARINGVLGDDAAAMRGLRECFGPQGHPGVVHEIDLVTLRGSREFREFIRPKD
jgi:tetratricopeptide (TPR) repeat protein/TolB-like protein